MNRPPCFESIRPLRFDASPRREAGVALVVTLLLLVAVVAIVLSFLLRARFDYQSSHGYGKAIQVEMLASGVLDSLVANTIEEIADPAHSEIPSSVPDELSWFEPKKFGEIYPTMLPDRTATGANDPRYRNLLKQSRPGQPFYSGGNSGEASDVPTTRRSTDGRFVDGVRWSLPKLLGDASGVVKFADADVPYWIYLQANGEPTTSATGEDATQIIGRYAYNVYEVGGLLNINAAGNKNVTDENVGAKGALTLVDLEKIPGMDSNAVSTVLDWRVPYVDWATTGDPNNPAIPGVNLSLLDYLRVGSADGWLRNPSPASTGQGNQFLTRRDLLKFFEKKGLSENALPYLTHFNVDLDAPTFSPNTDILKVAGVSAVANLRESSQNDESVSAAQPKINPGRADSFRTWTAEDGTVRQVPVLAKRFPLSRLGYVKTHAADRLAGSNDDLTKKYFGLVREGGHIWKYQDEEGGTHHIKRLEEVAAAAAANPDREPNFFEVLKSVIQVGSLGQHKQPTTNSPDQALEPFANVTDEHILRIGAAIIDQADEDNLPTCIRFNDGDGDATSFGEIYGVENLPYLYFLRLVAYRTTADSKNRCYIIQPSLWNPHNPFRQNTDGVFPDGFSIEARTANRQPLVVRGGGGWNSIPGRIFSGESISFEWDASRTPTRDDPNLFEPQAILSLTYPQGAQPITLSHPATMTSPVWNGANGEEANMTGLGAFTGGQACGFVIGNTDGLLDVPGTSQFRNGAIEFLLKYQPPGGGEAVTYDRIWFNPEYAGLLDWVSAPFLTGPQAGYPLPLGTFRNDGSIDNRIDVAYLKTDPRCGRMIWASGKSRFTNTKIQGASINWGAFPEKASVTYWDGVGGNAYVSYLQNWDTNLWTFGLRQDGASSREVFRTDLGSISWNRKITTSDYGMSYSDPDGVVRRAFVGPASTTYFERRDPASYNFLAPRVSRNSPFPMQQVAKRNGKANLTVDDFLSRPVVLNRPFRSVTELSYAFRDVPWKNVDFSLPESGDSGLLDVFCVNETLGTGPERLRADKVNINSAAEPVLAAMLSGAAMQLATPGEGAANFLPLTASQESDLVSRIQAYRAQSGAPSEESTGTNGPLRSLAELVGRVYEGNSGRTARFVGLHPEAAMGSTGDDRVLPERISSAARALADMSTVRTWNLMVDVVVQTGTAKNSLQEFTVSSEARWWMFVSVDRFTGQVLSQAFERVVE